MSAVPSETTSRHTRPPEYVRTIAFRVTDEQFIVADTLRATCDPPSFSEAFRWLLDDPDVRNLIARRAGGQ
jgi:hypothetical protein